MLEEVRILKLKVRVEKKLSKNSGKKIVRPKIKYSSLCYFITGLLILQGPIMALTASLSCFCHMSHKSCCSTLQGEFSPPAPQTTKGHSCCESKKSDLGTSLPKKGCCCIKKNPPVQAQALSASFAFRSIEDQWTLAVLVFAPVSFQKPTQPVWHSLPPPDKIPSYPSSILSSVILLLWDPLLSFRELPERAFFWWLGFRFALPAKLRKDKLAHFHYLSLKKYPGRGPFWYKLYIHSWNILERLLLPLSPIGWHSLRCLFYRGYFPWNYKQP